LDRPLRPAGGHPECPLSAGAGQPGGCLEQVAAAASARDLTGRWGSPMRGVRASEVVRQRGDHGRALLACTGRTGSGAASKPPTGPDGAHSRKEAVGWEDPVSKAAFARMHRNAVEVPSPPTEALCQAARSHGVHVVMGRTERDSTFSRGTLSNSTNSLIFIGGDGALLGAHRKLLPTHAERIVGD